MKQVGLGGSGLVSTRLVYGCMRVAGTMERGRFTPDMEEKGRRAILAAYEAGYTHFDHADIYGNGLCEEVFGRVLRDVSGMRERVVITSKCGIRWAGDPTADAPHRWDFSREHIVWSCEQSLRRLGVEQLDLLLLHRPDFLADPLEIAMAFEQLRAQGKVREFGVSNFMPSTVTMLQRACSMKLIVNQIEVHLARLAPLEDGTLDQCLTEGITPMSWSPLARGLLGAGGRPQADEPRAAVLSGLVETMDRMAERLGVSRGVLALAWLLRHSAGILPVVGTTDPERIRDAVRADSLELTREDWYTLTVAARGEGLP
jgi:predicted oxidoreductase